MWGRRKAAEGAGRWESTGGGGLLVRGLVKRGERERRETERERRRGGRRGRKRETNRFFIFAFQAYLMIFPQTDRQTQRHTQDTLARLKSFIPPNPGRSLLS